MPEKGKLPEKATASMAPREPLVIDQKDSLFIWFPEANAAPPSTQRTSREGKTTS